MKTAHLPLVALLAALPLVACRTSGGADGCCPEAESAPAEDTAQPGLVYEIMHFQSLSAGLAANAARRDFAAPPMEREVQVHVDPAANAWIVSATAADLVRVREIAAQLDATTAGADTDVGAEPSSQQVAAWLARRNVDVIHFEHQDAALAANAARQHLGAPDVAEPVILLVDREANSWIALADPRDREHVRAIAARYDRADGPTPRAR
ncbi:MAG: hypothetical protein GC161_05500 [Planctomycetaceae bacterium]|nr:hypothetical protein [Planctomycetaceae bacterium]